MREGNTNALKHGERSRNTPEYRTWLAMRERCNNPNSFSYHWYGQRGISVCERWNSYEAFLEDMGRKPGPKYSIDRINPDGPYSPDNCRWASAREQARNKSGLRRFELNGEMLTLRELADTTGIKREKLKDRLYKLGWNVERAILTP